MRDGFGREIDYMRISVIDSCNLNCYYCNPCDNNEHCHALNILSVKEVLCIVRAATRLGIKHFRLTGGEPLLHPQLDEIIFSGGDPLMAKDHELDWLMTQLEAIPHVKRLRIHSRLPIVIPARITETLASRFQRSSLQVILVNHVNHANEIDGEFRAAMAMLSCAS